MEVFHNSSSYQFFIFIIIYLFATYSENIGELFPKLQPFLPHNAFLTRLDLLESRLKVLENLVANLEMLINNLLEFGKN